MSTTGTRRGGIGLLAALTGLLLAVLVVPPGADAAGARPAAPTDLVVELDGRDATVRWSPVADPRVVAYSVRVVADDDWDTEVVVRVPQGPTPTAIFPDLTMLGWHKASVWAITESNQWSDSAVSGGFTPAPEVELVSQDPIVQVGDGHDRPRDGLGSGQPYEHRVRFRLDEPLPVDARVRPYAIEQQTYGNDDGPDTVVLDGGYPTLPGDSVLVRAGETRGYFVILHWGDDWRRFEWSRTVYGLTSSTAGWTHDDRRIGALDVDQVRAEHLMYEDDPDRWPLVTSGSIGVEAGRAARVPVRLRTPAVRRTTLSYRTTAGSAEPSRDYTTRRGTVTIARGAKVAWVRVPTRARPTDVGRTRDFRVRVTSVRDDAARVLRRSGTTVRLR